MSEPTEKELMLARIARIQGEEVTSLRRTLSCIDKWLCGDKAISTSKIHFMIAQALNKKGKGNGL